MKPWLKKTLIGIGALIAFLVWAYLMLHVWRWFFLTTTRDLPPMLPF